MKSVLLIEDDTILRENTAELLELSGYDVKSAPNGKVGIDIAKSQPPDIIICDIMMPEVDGYSVLQSLSTTEQTKFIPFVFLSAKTERKDIRKGMDMGADDYITKPFREDELISAIESRLAKASILKDLRSGDATGEQPAEETIRSLGDLKAYFTDRHKEFTFPKGEVVYLEGSNSNYLYFVNKGVVKCHKLDEQGKELTTALYSENDLFGYTSFSHNIPYRETATAIQDTELVGITKTEFRELLDNNHKLSLELIELLTDDVTDVKDQLINMAYSSVQKKTAATILKFVEKLNTDSDQHIRISRNDLASVAGVATETLIRTMSAFKKQGLIDIEGRNIKILDIKKLQQVS